MNIPEKHNGTPDLLDDARFALTFMLELESFLEDRRGSRSGSRFSERCQFAVLPWILNFSAAESAEANTSPSATIAARTRFAVRGSV